MSFGIPSLSDIRNTVSHGLSSAAQTVQSTASGIRDLGTAAVDRVKQLASDGVDIGRGAVDAVRSVDVREAAATVRGAIDHGVEAARDGIKTGVEWTGQRTHEVADFARDHVPGGDNVASNAVRGAITAQEDMTRFNLGVVGGISREVVGLAGTVGSLATTSVEVQLSPEAGREYGQALLDGARGAVEATGGYVARVAQDPSRVGGDIAGVADAGKTWANGQIDRYELAFREGKGFETVGMDVGTVATYVVPIGGGPARGALTTAVREGGELLARDGVATLARTGSETLARTGGETLARTGGETLTRTGSEALTRTGGETLARTGGEAVARDAAVSSDALGAAASPDILRRTVGTDLQSLGEVTGTHTAIAPGPLPDNLAGTFAGGRYAVVELAEDTVLHRAGTASQPLGQFFTCEAPNSVIQTRIDSAVLPEWPGGGKSPLDSAFSVTIPKGTSVYVGEVGSQGGFYVGGTEQIVVVKPWTIPGVQVNEVRPLP